MTDVQGVPANLKPFMFGKYLSTFVHQYAKQCGEWEQIQTLQLIYMIFGTFQELFVQKIVINFIFTSYAK